MTGVLPLALWRVGPDYVFAHSASDAKAVVGDHHGCYNDDDIERPVCIGPQALHVVTFESVDDVPPWAVPFSTLRPDNLVSVEAPVSVWTANETRGFCGSTEW